MGTKLEQFIPIDPGAVTSWHGQHEQQALVKIVADDDDPDEDDDDDDEPDEDDDEDDPDEGKSIEELLAELKTVRGQLSKSSGSGKLKRDKIKKLNNELAEARAGKSTPKPKNRNEDDKPVDVEAIKAQAKEEAAQEARKTRIADKAEVALGRVGILPERLARAVKLLDFDDLDLNDDGTLDGLDDQLDELKQDWPELFASKRRKRTSTTGPSDRNGDDETKRKSGKTASEQGAARLLGRG